MPASHERTGSPPTTTSTTTRARRKSKQDNMFGPYVLLYTIGEGEFAKVKYGIHSDSGEEAAIKLIRKENVDAEKLSKIKREISVLKSLSHPYIVSLIEVIETQNYIGIVLEYASGGELFDHILAHRYLKEREACRLFAQLICGVDYLHRNKIIHRDLKLENLLLDRNRNIIITDFGFANQFGKHGDDLMATSCGSPCYAAPELVVSDYAMLAGYLPFDDDPENPEGDNINLLYKYILSTPLSFPDYVGSDARDLLRRMLVPDPTKRCKIKDIMNHRWMAQFKGLFEEFKLKAKLEFVTGTPTGAQDGDQKPPPDVGTKSKRHTIQLDSAPRSQDGTLPPLDSPQKPPNNTNITPTQKPSNMSQISRVPTECSLLAEEKSQSPPNHISSNTNSDNFFDPHASSVMTMNGGARQPLDPFDPNTMVMFDASSSQKMVESPPKARASRKSKTTNNASQTGLPISTRQSKARPISMMTPSSSGNNNSNNLDHPDPMLAGRVVPLAPESPRSDTISEPWSHRPTSMGPSTSRPPATVVALTPESPTDSENRRSNRYDTRKAFSAVIDSNPSPISNVHRQATLSPAANTARKISQWIKRKSVVIKGGGTLPNTPDIAPLSAQRESLAIQRDGGAIYRLRYHRGAVDQFALTSRAPPAVMADIKVALSEMGFVSDKEYDYKMKLTRPPRGAPSRPASAVRRFTFVGLRDLLQIRPRNQNSNSNANSIRGGSSAQVAAPLPPPAPDSLYGDSSIDNGEEIRLVVELCRIKNFPNLYILDIKRHRGNVWSYKFLYHLILEKLQLNSNGGYLNPGV